MVALAGRLACPDERSRSWADAVGVECGPVDAAQKTELDAVVAHLYGVTKAQLVHVFETLQDGWDHQDRLDAVFAHIGWSKRR